LKALSVILTTYDKIADLVDNKSLADELIKSFNKEEEKLKQKELELEQEKER
jgi:hypothetical protein